MRTVIVGNRKLARYLLRHLLEHDWNVVGVLVPEGDLATEQANFTPVDDLVVDTDCELHKVEDINDEKTVTWLNTVDPDLCLCGGWSQIIKKRVLNVPNRGFFGFHSSQLPKGRGGAPVNWRLINGDEEVWISLFEYVSDIDAGDILAQGSVSVQPRDNVKTVFDALASEACRLVSSIRSELIHKSAQRIPQEIENATYRPRRQPKDGLIDWQNDPETLYNWIRSQTKPYPGAYTFYDNERLTIWRSEPVSRTSSNDPDPGEVLEIVDGEGIEIQGQGGVIRLTRVQHGDRPPSWADHYARKVGVSPGDRFGQEWAPDDWIYTGLRGLLGTSGFDTNLGVDEIGSLDIVAFSGSSHEVSISVSIDSKQVLHESAVVDDVYRDEVRYQFTEPGIHSISVVFNTSEDTDTRHLKIFVHDSG
jgi:methionyl-tRNA formyltransferase